jgi:hypothetical protein
VTFVSPEWITAISTLALAIAAFFAIGTWKKEMRGSSKYDLARKVLKAVYKLQWQIRSSTSTVGMVFVPEAIQNRDEYIRKVHEREATEIAETFSDLQTLVLEVKAVMGPETAKVVESAMMELVGRTNPSSGTVETVLPAVEKEFRPYL